MCKRSNGRKEPNDCGLLTARPKMEKVVLPTQKMQEQFELTKRGAESKVPFLAAAIIISIF